MCLEAVDQIFKILEDAAVIPPELGRIFKGEASSSCFILDLQSKAKEVHFPCIRGGYRRVLYGANRHPGI